MIELIIAFVCLVGLLAISFIEKPLTHWYQKRIKR